MSGSMMLERYVRRCHLAEELAESWPQDSDIPDPEAIVDEMLQLREIARAAHGSLLCHLFDPEKTKTSFHTEDQVRKGFSRALRAFQLVSAALQRSGEAHVRVETRDAFNKAFAEMRELRKQLDEVLPPFNPDTKQGIAEAQRGEGEFVEDLLGRLQDQNPAGGQ